MKKIIQLLGFLLFSLAATTQGVKRTELQRSDLAIAGKEAIQVVIAFEPGSFFGKHSHPGEELIYVLEGEIEYTIEGKAPVILKAGEVLLIPAGIVHEARNTGKVVAKELATYIVDKNKPLIKKL
jgi:quercetin dioxygenase-like cupin family protein